MTTYNTYELSARISRNDNLKKAFIALLMALPFLVISAVSYANARDIWGTVAIFAFGMVWAVPSIVFFKRAYACHRFGAQRREALDRWLNQQ